MQAARSGPWHATRNCRVLHSRDRVRPRPAGVPTIGPEIARARPDEPGRADDNGTVSVEGRMQPA